MLESDALQEIGFNRAGGLLTITLDRPQAKNALTPAMLDALSGILESNIDCRFVVIRGSECGAFSSGFDLNQLGVGEERAAAGAALESALAALEAYPRVTAAAVDGWCVGAGLELALCCDLRLATSRSHFYLPAATLGVSYPEHGLRRLLACAGRPAALRIALLAEKWSAEDAHQAGIVHEVSDDLDRLIEDWFANVKMGDPEAIANMKYGLTTLGRRGNRDLAAPERCSHVSAVLAMDQ